MTNYRLSNTAKEDLIRIHHYGVKTFGEKQANEYGLFDILSKYSKNVLKYSSACFSPNVFTP